METKQKGKKQSIYKMILAYALVCFVILLVVFSIVNLMDKKELDYFKSQTRSLCSISNDYRNITLTVRPSLIDLIPPEINCTQIMLEK